MFFISVRYTKTVIFWISTYLFDLERKVIARSNTMWYLKSTYPSSYLSSIQVLLLNSILNEINGILSFFDPLTPDLTPLKVKIQVAPKLNFEPSYQPPIMQSYVNSSLKWTIKLYFALAGSPTTGEHIKFKMDVLQMYKTSLERQVAEGVLISKHQTSDNILMDSTTDHHQPALNRIAFDSLFRDWKLHCKYM